MAGSSRSSGSQAYGTVVDQFLGTFGSDNTRAAYRADLNSFGRWCAQHGSIPLRVVAADLAAFQASRQDAGDSPSTVRRRWSSLSSFFQFAVDNRFAAADPTRGANRPRIVTGDPSPTAQLSAGAVDAYLAVAAGLDRRLEALVALLVFDGLKLGEALDVDVDDLAGRPSRMSLVVRRNGSERRVNLVERSSRAVYRCAGRRSGEPLFTSGLRAADAHAPRRLTRFGADHLIRQLGRSGQRVTANELRRFHINATRAAGTELKLIRDRAGLDDVRSVKRFLTDADPSSDGPAHPDMTDKEET